MAARLDRPAAWHCRECGTDVKVIFGGPVPLCRCGLVPTYQYEGETIWREPAPAHCPQGHPLGPGQVSSSWRSCWCPTGRRNSGGHRTWRCTRCNEVIEGPPCSPA